MVTDRTGLSESLSIIPTLQVQIIIREQLNPVQCGIREILSQLHSCCKYIKDMLMNCKGEATPQGVFALGFTQR
jgi:hypothetical protein